MITSYTDKLIDNAAAWLQCKEDKGTPNRSACLTVLHKLYGGEPTNEPWCAIFVWSIVNETCKQFNITNKLPKTKSTTLMKQRSPNAGLRVDKTPAPGSVFYYKRSGGGHVGFVVDIKNGELVTIEGNLSDSVRFGKRPLDQHDFTFIHTEEMTSKRLVFNKSPYIALLGVTGVISAYFTWRKFV